MSLRQENPIVEESPVRDLSAITAECFRLLKEQKSIVNLLQDWSAEEQEALFLACQQGEETSHFFLGAYFTPLSAYTEDAFYLARVQAKLLENGSLPNESPHHDYRDYQATTEDATLNALAEKVAARIMKIAACKHSGSALWGKSATRRGRQLEQWRPQRLPSKHPGIRRR